jgi:hypothetical protein
MAAGGCIAAPVIMNLMRGEDPREMLLESEARLFRDAGRVGVDGLEKALDFRLDLLMARRSDLRWLDVNVHFPLHSLTYPQTTHSSASKRKPATRIRRKHTAAGEVSLGGKFKNRSENGPSK